MDIATVGGLLLGIVLILGSIMLGGSIVAFINIPSILVTVGGAVSATLISYPLSKVLTLIKVVMITIFSSTPSVDKTIETMLRIGEAYVKDGNKGVEQEGANVKDAFLKKALILVEEGNKGNAINTILKKEIVNMKDRHKVGQNVLDALATYAPAFGMIGTLMGLVQMLRSLEDPSQIGAGMSVALLTTFYGAIVANLFCAPMAEKLKDRCRDESVICEIVREGLVAIVSGAKKRELQNRMVTYLHQKSRKKFES